MAFTGDLEHLHIVDIIQLIHTTRKSGNFSVRGSRGESQILFSNGYIVGASHLNNRVRIGTVLVKMNLIAREDLEYALSVQKNAGKDRKPLICTLIELGKLRQEDASKGLRKLIEITIVELIGWNKGTFTLDTEDIAVTPECTYSIGEMEQEVSLDAQMILMDALRIYDERERDRISGEKIPLYEDLFADVIAKDAVAEESGRSSVITADDLGLADVENLEKKIPQPFSVQEIFSPVEIHRQNIKDNLGDFSSEEQDIFFSFLEKCFRSAGRQKDLPRPEKFAKTLILFSRDTLIKHAIMTMCKNEGILVFATDKEDEFSNIIEEYHKKRGVPILVFDSPDSSEQGISEKSIFSLRQRIKSLYPHLPFVQFASLLHYTFFLQSFEYGVRAVFPKPLREFRKEMFVEDTIKFLETFTAYINTLLCEQQALLIRDEQHRQLLKRFPLFREMHEPSQIAYALLESVAGLFERAVTFILRPAELAGERALGVHAAREKGPTSAAKLKIPLNQPSIFADATQNGEYFWGSTEDEVLKKYLFDEIGAPLKPTVLLLPMKSRGKVVTITYADFGSKEGMQVSADMLSMLADHAGLAFENVLNRKKLSQASHK